MAVGLGGAVFENDGGQGLQRAAAQIVQLSQERARERRYEQKIEQQQAQQEQKQAIANQAMIESMLNSKNYSVNDLYSPMLTGVLSGMKQKLTDLSNKGVDAATLRSIAAADASRVNGWTQGFKSLADGVDDLYKSYGQGLGFSKSQISNAVMNGVFYKKDGKGNKTLVPLDDLDFGQIVPNLESIMKQNASELGVGSRKDMSAYLKQGELSTESANFSFRNKDTSGRTTASKRNSKVSFDPRFYDVKDLGDGSKELVTKTTAPVDPKGRPYIDPSTGQPAAPVINEDAFDELYTHSLGTSWNIDGLADQEADKLRKAGKMVNDFDMEYLKRRAATDFIYSHRKYTETQGQSTENLMPKISVTVNAGKQDKPEKPLTANQAKTELNAIEELRSSGALGDSEAQRKTEEVKRRARMQPQYTETQVQTVKSALGSIPGLSSLIPGGKKEQRAPPKKQPQTQTGQKINKTTGKKIGDWSL